MAYKLWLNILLSAVQYVNVKFKGGGGEMCTHWGVLEERFHLLMGKKTFM